MGQSIRSKTDLSDVMLYLEEVKAKHGDDLLKAPLDVQKEVLKLLTAVVKAVARKKAAV